jgi:dihydrofolate reductase
VSDVVVMLSVSLDGYFEGPGGDLSWHRVDEVLHTEFNQVLAGMGAFLQGRVMFEEMAAFWPTADRDPESSPAMVEFAGIWRDKPKVVYSRTLEKAQWNSVVVRDVVAEEVLALKEKYGDLALGGGDVAAAFLELDLVDELRLYVQPVMLGGGRRLLPEGRRVDLELRESRRFDNGVVLVRYGRG